MKPYTLLSGALLVIALALSSGFARATYPFKTIPVQGSTSSAVMHAGLGKLYVVDGGGVAIVDASTLVIAGRIPTASGSLLLDEPNNRLYVLEYTLTSGASGGVEVIDTSTDTYLTKIALPGTFYYAMDYNALTRRLYAVSESVVAVIDATLNQVVSTVAAGPSDLRTLCINAATNRIYVVNRYHDNVTIIDGATNTEVPGSPVVLGERPTTCVVDGGRNRVIVTNLNSATLSVIDGATNAITATIPVNAGSSAAIADDTLNLLAVGGDRTVSFFRLDTLALIKEVGPMTSRRA